MNFKFHSKVRYSEKLEEFPWYFKIFYGTSGYSKILHGIIDISVIFE